MALMHMANSPNGDADSLSLGGTRESQCFISRTSLHRRNLHCLFEMVLRLAQPEKGLEVMGQKHPDNHHQHHQYMIVLITGCTGGRRIRGSIGEPAVAVNRPV